MLPDLRFAVGAVLATALLVVTAFGVATTLRLAQQAKTGPLETRSLAYADQSDWNQFSDPTAARRFEELMRPVEGETMPATLEPAAGAPPPIASLPVPESSTPAAADVPPMAETAPAITRDAKPVGRAMQDASVTVEPSVVDLGTGADVVANISPDVRPATSAPPDLTIDDATSVPNSDSATDSSFGAPHDTAVSFPQKAVTASNGSNAGTDNALDPSRRNDVVAALNTTPIAASPASEGDRAFVPTDQPSAPATVEIPTVVAIAIESRTSTTAEASPVVPATAPPAPTRSARVDSTSAEPSGTLAAPIIEPAPIAETTGFDNAPTHLPTVRVTTEKLPPLPRAAPARHQFGKALTPARRAAARRVFARGHALRVARALRARRAAQLQSRAPTFTATTAQPNNLFGSPPANPWLTAKRINNKVVNSARSNDDPSR